MIHDREYFCKYTPAETALKILRTRTLKYSSPTIFNDPFDTQTRMDFDFEVPELIEAFSGEIYKMMHGPEEPVGDENNELFRDIKKSWYIAKQSQRKMPEDIWRQKIKSLNEETVRICTECLEEMNNWWYCLSKASRILCLAEDQEDLLMWAHYAQDHTGVVIKFKCIPELDTPFMAARKVNYSCTPPVIAELNDYVQYLTGQSPDLIDYHAIFFKLFLTKSTHWCYEQEWRVFIPPFNLENPSIKKDDEGREILFDLIPFHPQELHSIYFGCKISEKNAYDIMECLQDDMEHVKKYNSIRNDKEYKLDFEEIS